MGIGYTEILMVFVFAIAAFLSVLFKSRYAPVMISFVVCMAIAAVATPADPASCLFIGILLFAAYQIGGRFGSPRIPVAG